MGRRTAEVRSVPSPFRQGEQPQVVGRLVDPGDGKPPFGTTAAVQSMLDGSRTFDYYYLGWSNGYWETQPVSPSEADLEQARNAPKHRTAA